MSYILLSSLEDTTQIINTVAAAKVKGAAEIVNNALAFYIKDSETLPERMVMITGASVVEADCDGTVTFNAGDNVYDSDTTPTGIVNKTSGAGRRVVGKVYESVVLGSTKVKIVFYGGNH